LEQEPAQYVAGNFTGYCRIFGGPFFEDYRINLIRIDSITVLLNSDHFSNIELQVQRTSSIIEWLTDTVVRYFIYDIPHERLEYILFDEVLSQEHQFSGKKE
jgi:hypothetical protein